MEEDLSPASIDLTDAAEAKEVDELLQRLKLTPPYANTCDDVGMTPLMNIALKVRGTNCARAVEALLKASADPLATDFKFDRTALHWACEADNLNFIRALEAHAGLDKVQFLLPDLAGKTPFIIAREKQFLDVLDHITKARKQGLQAIGPHGFRMAVIGMGVAGTSYFIHLISRLRMAGPSCSDLCQKLTIYLVDSKATLGQGMPYSPEFNSPTSLLNIAAGGMSIDTDNPNDFVLWIKEQELQGTLDANLGPAGRMGTPAVAYKPVEPLIPFELHPEPGSGRTTQESKPAIPGQLLCPPSADVAGYYPRLFFGRYVAQRLDEAIATARSLKITVEIRTRSLVVDEQPAAADGTIQLLVKPVPVEARKRAVPIDESRNPIPPEMRSKAVAPVKKEEPAEIIAVDSIFYATGHYTETIPPEKLWKESPLVVRYPAPTRKTNQAVLDWVELHTLDMTPRSKDAALEGFPESLVGKDEPFKIGILGSSLSAIDAIFACLLRPDIGRLVWTGDTPRYVWASKSRYQVICMSNRGLFSRVRPDDNKDLDLRLLSPFNLAKEMAKSPDGHVALPQVIKLLETELQFALGESVDLLRECDPFRQEKAPHRDPFRYLREDLEQAVRGDKRTVDHNYVRWYQVVHALFPVVRKLYRQFTPKERATFDSKYNSSFLWGFSPMPPRSARVLLALHEAGALELHRISGDPTPDLHNKSVQVSLINYDRTEKTIDLQILLDTTGLATNFDQDSSPFTASLKQRGLVSLYDPDTDWDVGDLDEAQRKEILPKDRSMWVSDDGSFEIIDSMFKRSPKRRGVGFFLHSQQWDVQAVPTATRYTKQASELTFDELRWRHQMGQGAPDPLTLPSSGPGVPSHQQPPPKK